MINNSLKTILNSLEILREEIDPELPIQMAVVFLQISIHKEIAMKDLMKITGLSQASISRNIAALSELHRMDKPGYNLIIREEDPAERRRKIVRLNSRGKRVVSRISGLC